MKRAYWKCARVRWNSDVLSMKSELKNLNNWRSLIRVFRVCVHPLRFLAAFLQGRTLSEVVLRTPVGKVHVKLRNLESLKTLFSIFCRGDYLTEAGEPFEFVDVGANIGIASIYFLSRNRLNRVTCFEPDRANLAYLEENLSHFKSRSTIYTCAIGTSACTTTFFRSEDGKYSSLVPSEMARLPDSVECRNFSDALQEVASGELPLVVKLDVEGLEPALVRGVRWIDYPSVTRIICDSVECSAAVSRRHTRIIRNGYVEDIRFTESAVEGPLRSRTAAPMARR